MNLLLLLYVVVLTVLVAGQARWLAQYRRRCRFNDKMEKIQDERAALQRQVLSLTREQLARAQFDARAMAAFIQSRPFPPPDAEADWWKKE